MTLGHFGIDLGQEKSDLGQSQNDLGQEKNDLGQEKSDLGHFGPAGRFPEIDLVLTEVRKNDLDRFPPTDLPKLTLS